ncbi:DUF1294 domain-containing protein [Weissella soli]|uniref:DUF1294 domain-containing protein n=1 Tax=Weissella soli TaxID=155866 RepID=UPI0021BE31B6|nr:DUF1294 domain-containing protein [Weissella soli]MCT8394216.1 DUF1294 domain-containing protein [Weissella soli]
MTLFGISILVVFIWNIMVLAAYAADKRKAIAHAWRTPEKTLLTMAVIFGGYGALLGGLVWHHKTKKWYFWLAWLIGIILVNMLFSILRILHSTNKI